MTERKPLVRQAVERGETPAMNDLLSNVYVTVLTSSLRGTPQPTSQTLERKVCEVSCADTDELGSKIVFGFVSGGFSLWELRESKAFEIITETKDSSPIRCIRLLPPARNDRPIFETEASREEEEEEEFSNWDENNRKPNFGEEQSATFAFVESKRDHLIKFYSTSLARVVEELAIPCAVDDLKVSPRFFAAMLKNHSAQVYFRNKITGLLKSPLLISHAHPLALGMRWIAFAMPSPLDSNPISFFAPTSSSTSSPNTMWSEITKSLAASAFKLGEAGSKKLTDYLAQQSGSSSNTSSLEDNTRPSCVCDIILVRDPRSQKTICKISDYSSGLSFDQSGSILVTSMIDGQSLHVYSLPTGQLLYNLERGLSPAKIVHLAFSLDRKWFAATSARGTTHIFAIDPSGSRASVASHVSKSPARTALTPQFLYNRTPQHSPQSQQISQNTGTSSHYFGWIFPAQVKSSNHGVSEPRYMMEVPSEAVNCIAVSKISSNSGVHPVRSVKFLDKSTIRIVSQNGIVDDYNFEAHIIGNEADEDILGLETKLVRSFNLSHDISDSDYVPLSKPGSLKLTDSVSLNNYSHSNAFPVLSSAGSFDLSISNFEVQPFQDPLLPTWALPQFSMIQTTEDFNNTSIFFVPNGNILEIRGSTPPPGLADAIKTSAFPAEDL